ncbi:hypothetical protein JL721_10675 [Aureococcus anophagefferens]|nr:hypothetical protein JL721_10675 [Aureococcus anophagefferens]
MMRASQRLQRSCSLFVFVAALFAVVLSRRRDASTTTLDAAPYLRSESWLAATILPLNSSALMPLAARVTYDARGAAAKLGSSWEAAVAVRYAPRCAGGDDFALWTEATSLNASAPAGEAWLARLRANATYDAEVWLRVGRSAPTRVAATTFATAALGYERFDRGARVAGPNANVFDRTSTCAYAAPALGNMSFEVGTFAAFELAVPAAGNVSGAKAFNGVVGVDGAGAVVDFLGSLRRRSEVACTGRNRNYNQASHECRVDRRAGLPAWTQYEARQRLQRCCRRGGGRPPGAGWDRASGALEPVYALARRAAPAPAPTAVLLRRFDLASPEDALFPSTTWSTMSVSCSGGGDGHASLLPTFDFHHAGGRGAAPARRCRAGRARGGPAHRPRPAQVSLGASGDLVVSSRTLNTVWALRHDGSGPRWALSSSLARGRKQRSPPDVDVRAFGRW